MVSMTNQDSAVENMKLSSVSPQIETDVPAIGLAYLLWFLLRNGRPQACLDTNGLLTHLPDNIFCSLVVTLCVDQRGVR